jgi:serine/threonine protein kinase
VHSGPVAGSFYGGGGCCSVGASSILTSGAHVGINIMHGQAPAGSGIPLTQVREYGRQALMALRFLCKLDIVHNDIKLDNFLLTEKKSRWSQKVRFVLYSAGALS